MPGMDPPLVLKIAIYLTSHFEPKYLISFDVYFCYLVFGKKLGGPYQFESFSLVSHVH